MPATTDPVECLAEIAALCMDRMNGVGPSFFGEPTAAEAFTLGEISGICCRVDAVMDALREREDLAAGCRHEEGRNEEVGDCPGGEAARSADG
jgi:hypothetical protein